MDKKYQTAPCGLDCFNCDAYVENITDEYKMRAAEYFNISPDETVCKGCRDEQGRVYHIFWGREFRTVPFKKYGSSHC